MSFRVDLNCDMGESFGAYTIGHDAEVVRHITSANIACGFHASDPIVMKETVRLCKDHNVAIGAHPGYPDLAGFGRREMNLADDDIIQNVLYQIGALSAFTAFFKVPLRHVKLHGALYNHVMKHENLFLGIIRTVKEAFGDLLIFTLGTPETKIMKKRLAGEGHRLILEAFPDRNYADDGFLLPRKYPEAVIKESELIAERAISMVKDGTLKTVNGHILDIEIDTLCVHGDNPESIKAASMIRHYAIRENIAVKAPGI